MISWASEQEEKSVANNLLSGKCKLEDLIMAQDQSKTWVFKGREEVLKKKQTSFSFSSYHNH